MDIHENEHIKFEYTKVDGEKRTVDDLFVTEVKQSKAGHTLIIGAVDDEVKAYRADRIRNLSHI